MTTREKNSQLAQIKLALAEKYERLARVAGSIPKQKKFAHQAHKYRRQAQRLSHE